MRFIYLKIKYCFYLFKFKKDFFFYFFISKIIMSEFYTDNSEEVDIDKLNKILIEKSFEDRKYNIKDENNLTEEEYKINEIKFLQPDLSMEINNYETENEYIPKKTDPYKRILELKVELIENKALIDSMVNKFNDTSIIQNTNNYSELFSNININKKKIDAFIDYDLFNNRNEDDSNNKEKNDENNEKLYSLYDKYDRLSDNLLMKIKDIENNIINENNHNEIEYKIESNPSNNLNVLINSLNELEELISDLEKKIGNWDLYKNKENISMNINKIFNLFNSKNKYDNKNMALFKQFGEKIKEFNYINKEKINIAKTYIKLKEIYSIYEIQQNYKQLIDYMKQRIKATREVCYSSKQFNIIVNDINDLIKKNNDNFEELNIKYKNVLDSFKSLENILKEIDKLDNKIKKKI